MQICDLIISGRYVLTIDAAQTIFKNGAVAILGDKILAVDNLEKIQTNYQAQESIDVGNSIIMPGLINAHTHAAMTFLRGLADDLPLDEWLQKHIWPAEGKNLNADFVYKFTQLACLEMIKSGTTCFNDMYFFADRVAEAAINAGMRAVISEAILVFPTASSPSPDKTIEIALDQIEIFKNNELIEVAFAPHSIYTCSREVLEQVAELARKHNKLIHIHLSETKKELADCQTTNGKSPVAYLKDAGLLSERTIAAHSIWLSEEDLDIYKQYQVKVAHSPISNMKLASGVMPLGKMRERGITAGLGTDGAASNNTLDMWSDMRTCALLHKISQLDPTAATARDIIKMATIDGAKVLGLDKKLGSLEVGKRADMITINLNQPHLTPIYDPYSHLAYAVTGSDVNDVLISGRVVMRNRSIKTIDEEKILNDIKNY